MEASTQISHDDGNRDLMKQLDLLGAGDGFEVRSNNLMEEWKSRGEGLNGVRVILSFMEAHPDLEYGMPGSMVHFAERFHRKGYEAELVQSLERRTTPHTAWMMNRLLNGSAPGPDRDRYMAVLEAAIHAAPDDSTRDSIAHYLSLQSGLK